MSRRAGGFRGAKPAWTTTSTPGVFGLSDVVDLKAAGQWPRGPAAPTNLAGTPGDGQVALTWTAPATTHGTITDYIVEYTPAAGSPTLVATGSTAASYTLTGLTNGTSYTVRVAAVNFTAGDYSAAVTQTPVAGTPPNAPTSLTATAGNAQIALAWTAPSAPGTSAITGYVVEYTPSGGSASTMNTNSTSTSYTLTGLTNGTAYTVRVAAISAVGTGTYSATATGTPGVVPLRIARDAAGTNLVSTTGLGTAASPFEYTNPAANTDHYLLIGSSGTLNFRMRHSCPDCGLDYTFNGVFKNWEPNYDIWQQQNVLAVTAGQVIAVRDQDADSQFRAFLS